MKLDLATIKQNGSIELLAKQLVEGFITGLHSSPYHGFSVEFAEHRLYNDGESTRHIDWKVFSKTDKLFTKRYEEETNLRCQLLIDTSGSMFYPVANHGKLTFSITAAAALAYLLQKQKDAVGLSTFSETIELETPTKSTSSHIHTLFVQLEQLLNVPTSHHKSAVAHAIHQLAEKIHKRSLVVIFSDMFETMEDAEKLFSSLQHLKHNKHEVLLFHVYDSKTEEQFEFEDRPYEFVDIETQERVKLNPANVKAYYTQEMAKYYEEIRLKCGQYKIDFIKADINESVDHILQSYLIKRGRMR